MKRSRPVFRLAVLVSLLSAGGCGTPSERSDQGVVVADAAGSCAQLCPGCCDKEICMSGTSDLVCGQGGEPCSQCTANEICREQECIGSSTRCNPAICASGCCRDDVCLSPSSDEACGIGGGRCVDCASMSLVCSGGECIEPCRPMCEGKCQGASDGCDGLCPINQCNGCCTASSACLPGTATVACGIGGLPCQTCTDLAPDGSCAEQVCCLPSCAGKCKGASDGCKGTCTSNTCTGCCSGTVCQTGDVDWQCGENGWPCEDCTIYPMNCANHMCVYR